MRFHPSKNYAAQMVFPLVLLTIFTVCALLVVLLAANVYRRTAEDAAAADYSRTAVSYLVEKVHQQDRQGEVFLTEFDGCTALELRHSENGVNYSTFLFASDGMLRELMQKEGGNAAAADGRPILPITRLEMKKLGQGLLFFRAVEADGSVAETAAALRSGEELKK